MPMPPRFSNKSGAKSPSIAHTSSSSSSSNESGSGSGSSESSESSDSESSSEESGTHKQIRKRDQEAKKELLKVLFIT